MYSISMFRTMACSTLLICSSIGWCDFREDVFPLKGESNESIYGYGEISDAHFLSNGDLITAGGLGLLRWNSDTGELKQWVGNRAYHQGVVRNLALSADNKIALLASSSQSGQNDEDKRKLSIWRQGS